MGDDDDLPGFKRGESVEHQGEPGRFYRSVVELTRDELMLYARVSEAWGDRDLGSRDNAVALVERVAAETIPDPSARETMSKNVIAYIDEITDRIRRDRN